MIKNIHEANAEDRAYRAWERDTKNQILRMASEEQKRALWQKHFPMFVMSDDYLAGNIF